MSADLLIYPNVHKIVKLESHGHFKYVAPFSFKNQLGEQRELKSVIISRAHGGFTAKENSFYNKVIRRDRMLRSSIFNEPWPHDDEGRAM